MYKLLIVDDSYEIRHGLYNYFPWSQVGFEVAAQAENGKQAFDLFQHNHFDVILCDVRMPIMTGIDLARQLYECKSKVKIVFLSAYKDFEYAQKALIYGVRNYITKPAKFDDLIQVFAMLRDELDSENISNSVPQIQSPGSQESDGSCFSDKVINVIKNHVKENYKNVTLEEVAVLVHMSPHYVSKFFKEKTGQNFSDYVIMVKMEKAADLLKSIELKTYEVSEQIGYSNAKNFTRTFTKYFGKSPRDYRNSNTL